MVSKEEQSEALKRGTGLLILEAVNSNPNGDPDRESDPRQRNDGRGLISPVSFKRKLRDLVENKEGPVWQEVAKSFGDPLPLDEFAILESRGRDRKEIRQQLENGTFAQRYWDGRLFGNTFLEEEASTAVKTGVAQFGLGVSVSPVQIERMTTTNKAGVQEGKDRGMAPMSYRIVEHGVYCMPFFVNPTAASKSGCTQRDVELMLRLIPYAYTHSASYVRPFVTIRHAWYAIHGSPLGSCPDHLILEALKPTRKDDPEEPSTGWDDYDAPAGLPEEVDQRLERSVDLMALEEEWITL